MSSLKRALKVPLQFHWSSPLLLILLLLQNGAIGLAYFAILMFSLLVHEYCHVWMAVKENLYVQKVLVFALGAAALIDSRELMYDKKLGLKVAAAGPGGSFALAFFSLPFFLLFQNNIITYFFIINMAFGIFNLLPLFPSDGGRILYSLFLYVMRPTKAMKAAVYTSYCLSIIGLLVSLWFKAVWMVILFVFIIGFAKSQHEQFKKIDRL